MLSELTPEQMTGHIAAMRAEPWGEERADYRTAYVVYWLFNLLGNVEEGEEKPEAEMFLHNLQSFIEERTTKEKVAALSPDETVNHVRGLM